MPLKPTPTAANARRKGLQGYKVGRAFADLGPLDLGDETLEFEEGPQVAAPSLGIVCEEIG